MKKIFCIVVLLSCCFLGKADNLAVTATISLKIDGKDPGEVGLVKDDFFWTVELDRYPGCVKDANSSGAAAQWSGTAPAARFRFNTQVFNACGSRGTVPGDQLIVVVTINKPGNPYDGLSVRRNFVIGTASFTNTFSITKQSPSITLSDISFTESGAETFTATLSNIPADFAEKGYRIDWGSDRITTGVVSGSGPYKVIARIGEGFEAPAELKVKLMKDTEQVAEANLSYHNLYASKARPVVIAILYNGDPMAASWSFKAWLNGDENEIVTRATRYAMAGGNYCLFFDLQYFSGWAVNDILHVSVTCVADGQTLTTSPWTGVIGASALTTQWVTDESTFLRFPSVSLSGDFQLCEAGEQSVSRELTVVNAPEHADVRVFDGTEDVTSKFVVSGMTGLSIKPSAFTESSDDLSVVLMDTDGVTKLAEAPFRVNVKPRRTVKLSGDMKGRYAGDELLFEANRDEAVIPGDYYWFVNGQAVNGGRGWFVSNKLQEGDAVKCIVEEEGACAQRIVSDEVIVRYSGKGQGYDIVKAGGWDSGGFFVPNVITPNSDGMNDTWRLDFIQDYPGHLIKIYDYSGRLVYLTRHYKNDWEGRIDNVITYGVYTCVVDLGNGKTLKTWLQVKNNDAR